MCLSSDSAVVQTVGAVCFGSTNAQFSTSKEGASILADLTSGAGTVPEMDLIFRTSPGGSTAATERVRIDSAGNMGVGTPTASALLHLLKNQNGLTRMKIDNTTSGTSSLAGIQIRSDLSVIDFASHSTSRTLVRYGITLGGWHELNMSAGNGLIFGTEFAKPIVFGTNKIARMRIESDGSVGIGTLLTTAQKTLHVSDGATAVTGAASDIAIFQRATDPTIRIADTNAGGNNQGVIGQDNDTIRMGANANVIFKTGTTNNTTIAASGTDRLTIDSSGHTKPSQDNVYTCGTSGNRWAEIFAAIGTINTSDERKKKNIVNSDLGLNLINALTPRKYNWRNYTDPKITETAQRQKIVKKTKTQTEIQLINGKYTKVNIEIEVDELKFTTHDLYENGEIVGTHKVPIMESVTVTKQEAVSHTHTRKHYGLIAQEVKAAIESLGKNTDNFGGYIYDSQTDMYGLRYDEFTPVLIQAIKEQQVIINDLKSRIEILEA